MDLETYQTRLIIIQEAYQISTQEERKLLYYLGLMGECGEVVELYKKYRRDRREIYPQILSELGDVLAYLTLLAHVNGSSLEQLMEINLSKIEDRIDRNVHHGSGDYR